MEIQAYSVAAGFGEERRGRFAQHGSGGSEACLDQNERVECVLKALPHAREHTPARACVAHVESRS